MLTKRTNILFNEEVFQYLIALAQKKNTSVGDLVRKAVIKVYYENKNYKRAQAINKILKLKKSIKPISNNEIRELIEYGRKY